ncbi:Hypothetical protein HVR_LOCUS1357 [uncultured virus]|nr:Hypothetical protein HVR_LOCUS1357 [uncultured virus]
MGSNCGDHPEPDTRNLCLVSLGQRFPTPMPYFCTLQGVGGNNQRGIYCGLMSNAGEWGDPYDNHNGCSYNDCNNYQDWGFGCCRGCCGIVGGGLQCTRQSFTGDPVTCCFNDVNCVQNINDYTPQCFSDSDAQNTCADGVTGANGQFVPNYRNIVSPDCQDVLFQYCTGTLPTDDPTSTDWLARWTQNNGGPGSCSDAVTRNIFLVPNAGTGHCFDTNIVTPTNGICNITPPFEFDAGGYFWAQGLITATMKKYTDQGFQIGTLPGFPGYNPFQDFLYNNICCPYPGLCQDGLDVACASYTAQRMSLNPTVSQWCGCHLNPNEYQAYSVKFNIPPECTPMCNRSGTLPIVGINGLPINCTQDICLIDGVTVNLINSQIGGGINFNQICAGCQNSQCSCIVSDTTVDIANSTIGGNVVPIGEGCGSINCTQTNPGTTGPSTIPVPCGSTGFNPYAQYDAEVEAAQAEARKSAIFWTLVAIGAALVVIFLIIFFVHPNFYPGEGTTISREKPFNPSFQRASSTFQSIEGGSSAEGSFLRAEPASTESFLRAEPIGSESFLQGEPSSTGSFARESSGFSSIESFGKQDKILSTGRTFGSFGGSSETYQSIN